MWTPAIRFRIRAPFRRLARAALVPGPARPPSAMQGFLRKELRLRPPAHPALPPRAECQFLEEGLPEVSGVDVDPAPAMLRPPGAVMRLSRLGRFYPTRLSFARVLVRRMAREGWRIETAVRDLDDDGYGQVAYHVHTPAGVLGFAAFSHHLDPADRTDRVIAERWDASFALTLEPPTPADLDRLGENVPRQEAGRCGAGEIVLSRANRSVRLFDKVVASLADGRQPPLDDVGRVGYLLRTTAVYGNGKFGLADFERVRRTGILTQPFQAEMLAVYLIRHFSLELVDHLAARRGGGRAVRLDGPRRRALGIGNATGLGMAPFLVSHPQLIDRWVRMRETALARVMEVERASPSELARFRALLTRARTHVAEWRPQVGDADLGRRLGAVARRLAELERLAAPEDGDGQFLAGRRPWAALAAWAGDDAETGELLNSIVIELYPDRVDDLEAAAGSDERAEVRPEMPVGTLRGMIEERYGWALEVELDRPESQALFWYHSEEKEEPRLGFRYEEPGAEREIRLGIGRQAAELHRALERADPAMPAGRFLRENPGFRQIVRRVQSLEDSPYAEIHDNLLDRGCEPADLLRGKLSILGASRFDPKSLLWTRVTFFQGAPLASELGRPGADDWAFATTSAGAADTADASDASA